MKFTTINIQGNIFTSEILDRIRQDNISFQKPQDFGLKPNELVRDEISNAWSLVNTHWQIFKQKRNSLQQTDTGVSENRRYWIGPLLNLLGYEVTLSNAEIVNGKSYAISHRASNKDEFPIHIIGSEQSLEKKAENARLSPHALMQEYINSTEHIYGYVTNGINFRVLRDATRLSRLSYLEFNLEQMVEEGHYAEFAIFYRLLHASRLKDTKEEAKDAILEFYHNEALASGSRIRERLSEAVEKSIVTLANGLLAQNENAKLRELFETDKVMAKDYYLNILRSVYRILFLLVIEERNLIYKENLNEDEKKLKDIYYKYYSIQRLTYLVNKAVYIDPKKTDLWQSLLMTFRLFEDHQTGNALGLDALGSGIFSSNAIISISNTALSNKTVLEVFKYLVTFENENKQIIRVNYADLDVEEFGSVYEGLLEFEPVVENNQFRFKQGDDRSSSGSHYTPEELVKPLIVHSLDYIIADKLKEGDPEQALLSITVCDVACGSGHILLSAARRIGFELARIRSNEDQPTPSVLRHAIRDVIKNCIYGVDLNPLAVELCKVALWLEAHEPGQPLNFLDHHIKNGNAIVGLAHFEELEKGIASEAFKALPGDDKTIAAAFKKRNDLERNTKGQLTTFNIANADEDLKDLQKEFESFTKLPENTADQIAKKEKAYHDLTKGKKWFRLKQIADLQVAQFFIPKSVENKDKLTTHSQYISYLKTEAQILDRGAAMAVSLDKRFFHWFLEFPQVFQKGGFDCILGNPPYIAARDLNKKVGTDFSSFFKEYFTKTVGKTDFVAYFVRRDFELIKDQGFISLITTNSIAQGDTRISALEFILSNRGRINFAIKTLDWPGKAATTVSLFSINKNRNQYEVILNNSKVDFINSRFEYGNVSEPKPIKINSEMVFQGSILYGEGFKISKSEAQELLNDEINRDVIFPFITGDDLNDKPLQDESVWVIDFQDKSLENSRKFEKAFSIVEENVKPERLKKNDKTSKENWWKHLRNRSESYKKLRNREYALVNAVVSKYPSFSRKETNIVFSNKNTLFLVDKIKESILHSSIYQAWLYTYTTTMGASTISFSISECFENYPFPIEESELQMNFDEYITRRNNIMKIYSIGLTKFYNYFHNNRTDEFEKENGLLDEVMKFRKIQENLDLYVLKTYGWQDIALLHDFYEVDYLPENDRIRYTIHPEARKEVLKRLLELNHKIHAEEVAAGLWDKKKPVKKEKVAKEKIVKTKKQDTIQVSMFDTPNDTVMKEFNNTDGIYTISDVARIINKTTDRVRRWFNKLAEMDYEGLDGSVQTDIDNRRISFHGLIELVVIGELIENNFNINAIFKARLDLATKTGKAFPFATNNVNQKLKVSGSDITWDFEDGNITLNGKNQFNLDIVREFFRDIEFDTSGIAQRITPAKGLKRIEITPKIGGGKPSVISQKGVNVETILRFYKGPESIDGIMEDYDVTKEDIEAVLAYQS